MRRIVVVGSSGSGKTTLACELATRLAVPHVELDGLHWGPNWTPTPKDILRHRVGAALAGDGWTVCGNYLALRDVVWGRADTLIWLDYPMRIVVWRSLVRTFKRCRTGEPLWADNKETWSKSFFSTDSILIWVVTSWRKNRWVYPRLLRSPAWRHLRFYRFRSPEQTETWLNDLKFTAPETNAIHH